MFNDGHQWPERNNMAHQLPETGYLRLPQIIGNSLASPPIPALIPVSKSSWWAGVKAGRYPKAVKLGPRTTAWRVEDIRALIASA
jgi:prophage regulatory protein